MSIEHTDAEAATNATGPRVTLESMKEKIATVIYFTGGEAAYIGEQPTYQEFIDGDLEVQRRVRTCLEIMTICLVVMKTGFIIIGKSAPAAPENYNQELGRKFAYEDCIRQLWQLEGYALRERLASS